MNTCYTKTIFTTKHNSMKTSPQRMKGYVLFLVRLSDAIG